LLVVLQVLVEVFLVQVLVVAEVKDLLVEMELLVATH